MNSNNTIYFNEFLSVDDKKLYSRILSGRYDIGKDEDIAKDDTNYLSYYRIKISNILYLFNDIVVHLANINLTNIETAEDRIQIWKLFILFLEQNNLLYDKLHIHFQTMYDCRNLVIHNYNNYKEIKKTIKIILSQMSIILYFLLHDQETIKLYRESQSFLYIYNQIYSKLLKIVNEIYSVTKSNKTNVKVCEFLTQ